MLAKIRNAISMLLLVGLALGAAPAAGQEITGSIVGIVKDSHGAVVAGATVTIRNTDKNIVARTLTTNDEGSYSAPFLLAGRYSVTVEATGFKKYVKTDIVLKRKRQRHPVSSRTSKSRSCRSTIATLFSS
jgi:hypothetical protein